MFQSTRFALALVLTSAAIAAPAAPSKKVLRGTLSVVQEDDFQSGRTARVHTLFDDETGEPVTLRSQRLEKLQLRSGSRVVVRGEALGRELVLDSTDDALQVLAAADAPAMEARKAVVIVANFSDSAVSCSDASIAGLMWTGANSVNGLYQAASFGQVSVPNDVDNNGQPDVVRVTIPDSVTEACDPYGWASAAESAATAAGVNLGLYQHKVIVLPSNITCGWAGLGNVGCSGSCRAWVKTCNLQDVYAHEIGHNLDMAHASTDTNNDGAIDCEYCDMSDIMGYGGVGWRLFSAPHEAQKSWIPASKIQQVTTGGTQTYVLSPLFSDPATTPFPHMLKIQTPVTGDFYYLAYRQPLGYDATLSSDAANRTSIHRYSGSGYANTKFIAGLQDTQFFTDETNGFEIRQLSHDATSVTLQITTQCVHVAPTVTITPSRQNGAPGQELTFTATVKDNDPLSCGIMTYDIATAVPAGFAVSATPSQVFLSPGMQGTVSVKVTSPAGAAPGDNAVSVSTFGSSASAVYAVTAPDTNPPTKVTLSGAVKKGSVNLSWTASTDASGITAYRLFRNGVQIASQTARTFSDKPTVAGTYAYTVVAVDGMGLVSLPSNAYNYTVATTTGGGGGGRPPRR